MDKRAASIGCENFKDQTFVGVDYNSRVASCHWDIFVPCIFLDLKDLGV